MYRTGQSITKDVFKAEFEADDGSVISLSVYPPKMKVMRMLQQIDLDADTAMEETIAALSAILSNNREKKRVSVSMVEELFDVTDLNDFFSDFNEWVGNLKKK